MKTLDRSAWQEAKTYLFGNGRELDQMRFEFHFGPGNPEQVLAALMPYQNADGGFGHGLEPDLRTAASSAIATTQAFDIFRAIGRPLMLPSSGGPLPICWTIMHKTPAFGLSCRPPWKTRRTRRGGRMQTLSKASTIFCSTRAWPS